jgi:hypothetical protein
MHTSSLPTLYSPSMTLTCLTTPQSTSSATEILFGAWNTCIFHHLNDCCNSLRPRTHLPKRTIVTVEDGPRKRHRPLPGANSAADGRAAVGGVGINGFIFKAPGPLGRGRSTESSSSDTSSDNSSDDTSSNSESTSGSSSDSDSDSTSSSPSDDLVRPLPRPPPSFEPQRKPSQPRYVTSTLSRIYLSAAFVPQAYLSTAWIWEAADP